MALKLPIRFPMFAQPPSPQPPFRSPNGNPFRHRPSTEIRFSRWNKAIGDKFNQRQRALQEIEDEIRRERRFESANNIANTNNKTASPTAETFKSIGTPSSPSSPSIPGKKSKYSKPQNPNSTSHPAFRRISRVTKLPQTPKTEPINTKANVTIGKGGVSYVIEGAPFEFKYSYTETPKAKPLKLREPPFAPFGPATMPRPWTGRAPLPPSKKKLKEFDSFQLPPPHKKGVKPVQSPGPYLPGTGPRYVKSREEILGEPLTKEEIMALVDGCLKSKRQLNMGRDGLTHNMLDNIHSHWKRRRVCKIKCKGVCTVDMDNVWQQLEERTGGKIIYSRGGVLYLFRGRNYNYRTRPRFPLMLWKPVTPVYPRLIKRTPEGLTMEEAIEMRKKGRKLIPICKLGKNGIYSGLVGNVREAFEECELVRINCQGMNGSDYRKIGAKLKDLVPCVLISFENEHILMWRGHNWKSSFPKPEDVHKEAGQSDIDGATSIAPPLEDQQVSESHVPTVSVKEDASIEALDTNTSIVRSDNVGADGNEDQSSIENDKPYAVTDAVSIARKICESESEPISHNKNSAIDESEAMSNNNGCADEEPVPMSVGSEIMMGSVGSTGKQMEPSIAGAIIHDDAQDVLEASQSQDCSEPASMGASCTKEILLLLKQAVEGGSAIVLDNAPLDADSVYERAVALAQSAPPGPVFRHRPRKVAVKKCENEERGDLVMKEERGDLEMKEEGMTSSETNGSERKSSIERKSPKFRRIKDLDEKYLAAVPQGSLKVDELAKLLA